MSTTPTVYVICDTNCKYEGMTKEQILTAITQAVNEGTIGDIDTGFITTVKTISGTPLKFFVGTQAEYTELADEDKENLFAIITNDTTKENILAQLETLLDNVTALENRCTAAEEDITDLKQSLPITTVWSASYNGTSFSINGAAVGKTYVLQILTNDGHTPFTVTLRIEDTGKSCVSSCAFSMFADGTTTYKNFFFVQGNVTNGFVIRTYSEGGTIGQYVNSAEVRYYELPIGYVYG